MEYSAADCYSFIEELVDYLVLRFIQKDINSKNAKELFEIWYNQNNYHNYKSYYSCTNRFVATESDFLAQIKDKEELSKPIIVKKYME